EWKENTRNNLLLGSATSEGTESAQTLLWPKGQYVGHKEPGTFDKTEKGKAVTIGRCSSSTKLRGRRKMRTQSRPGKLPRQLLSYRPGRTCRRENSVLPECVSPSGR